MIHFALAESIWTAIIAAALALGMELIRRSTNIRLASLALKAEENQKLAREATLTAKEAAVTAEKAAVVGEKAAAVGEKVHTLVNSNYGESLRLNAQYIGRLAALPNASDADKEASILATKKLKDHEAQQAIVNGKNGGVIHFPEPHDE